MMCGGFKPEARAATEEEQEILNTVKPAVEGHFNRTFADFRAVSFTTQVVAGTNYIMKVKADEEFLHIKIAKPLPHTGEAPFLLAVDPNHHDENSPLSVF
jgi:cystatin-A/B